MQGNPLHGQNVNANLMADNLYACQVTFAQLLNFPLSPVFLSLSPPLSVLVYVCVCAALCMQRLPAASCWGLTKAKVPRCQVAVKLLLRARTQNRIEPNGMERNGTPNQIVIIRDGACDIPILLWTKLSHRSTKRQATFNMRKILYPCRV